MACGGYGEKVLDYMNRRNLQNRFLNISIPDAYVEHGNVELLKREIGIDQESIVKRICGMGMEEAHLRDGGKA